MSTVSARFAATGAPIVHRASPDRPVLDGRFRLISGRQAPHRPSDQHHDFRAARAFSKQPQPRPFHPGRDQGPLSVGEGRMSARSPSPARVKRPEAAAGEGRQSLLPSCNVTPASDGSLVRVQEVMDA